MSLVRSDFVFYEESCELEEAAGSTTGLGQGIADVVGVGVIYRR